MQLRRSLNTDVADGVGALDPAAITQVAEESWPDVRNADELHDALLTLILLPPVPEWQPWYEQLALDRRVNTLRIGDARVLGRGRAGLASDGLPDPAAVANVLRGWLDSIGPITAEALGRSKFDFRRDTIEIALAQLEAEGQILRGRFTPGIGRGRNRMVQPPRALAHSPPHVGALAPRNRARHRSRFHALPLPLAACRAGSQLHGVDGTLQILKQLQGYEIPAAAGNPRFCRAASRGYEPDLLDQLCLSGEVTWGRLSPHPAFERLEPRRVRPTRVAPLAIFLREDASWLMGEAAHEPPTLSHPAQRSARRNSAARRIVLQ